MNCPKCNKMVTIVDNKNCNVGVLYRHSAKVEYIHKDCKTAQYANTSKVTARQLVEGFMNELLEKNK